MKIKVYNSNNNPIIISDIGLFEPGDNNVDLNKEQIERLKKSTNVRIINNRSKQKKYNKIKEK
jgi:hypothetical protein